MPGSQLVLYNFLATHYYYYPYSPSAQQSKLVFSKVLPY